MAKLKPLTIDEVRGKELQINNLASCNRTPIPGPIGPVGPTGMAGPNTPLFSSVEKVTNATNLAPSGVSLINSFNAGYNVALSASTTGAIKSLILDYDTGSQVVVNTPRGSVFVQPGLPVRNMVYTNQPYWTSLDPDYTSFFPTTLNTTGIVGSSYIGQSYQGYSTAISDDGNTLAVGGPLDNVNVGAVWIYTQSGGVWTQQGEKLIAQDNAGVLGQGCGVALSGDGNTLAVGAGYPGDFAPAQIGATWIWARSGGVWTEQTKLVGTGYTGNSGQGVSVALSTDGQTLAVGGSNDNNGIGAVWIFTQSGGFWSQQGDKLVGTGGGGTQGYRVSLSADGNTLAFGAPTGTANGGTWIFTRSGGVWTQYGSKLVGTGGLYEQGTSVTLSADGNTLAISSGDNRGNSGFTWIFTFNGTTWSQQIGPLSFNILSQTSYLSRDGNTLAICFVSNSSKYNLVFLTQNGGTWPQIGSTFDTGYDSVKNNYNDSPVLSYDGSIFALGIAILNQGPSSPPGSNSGVALTFNQSNGTLTNQQTLIGTNDTNSPFIATSVNLSADGNTLAVGGNSDNSNIGATWIFTRSSGLWTQQGDKLVGTGYTGNSNQGTSVALSADGNTLAIGGNSDNNNIGATWVFTRSGGVWTQQGDKLVGTGYIGISGQGQSAALSADGNTLAVGGYSDDNSVGATWIFTRSSGLWTQQGDKLVGTGYINNPNQGGSVALSSDGNTLAVGAYNDNYSVGAAWIFTRSSGLWTQQGAKLVANDYSGQSEQGYSVSLSSDGNSLAVASPSDNNIGAVWVWTRSGIQWTQQGSKLVLNNNTSAQIVVLSADGNTLAVYSFDNPNNIGYATIYTRTLNNWFQQPSLSVSNYNNYQGLALNKSGDTMAVIASNPGGLTSSVSIFN